nr:hypothetical protein [uncultured Gimesia sp.]
MSIDGIGIAFGEDLRCFIVSPGCDIAIQIHTLSPIAGGIVSVSKRGEGRVAGSKVCDVCFPTNGIIGQAGAGAVTVGRKLIASTE